MKFIYFTDMHGRANNPVSRKDNFPETILKKLEWVVDQANKNNAYLLFGGDWLNRPDTSPSLIGRMAAILLRLRHQPCYTVIGNHDIYGYNIETFSRTPLYILEQFGLFRLLSKEQPVYLEADEDAFDGVVLTGVSSCPDIDKTAAHYITEALPEEYKKHLHIHIVHGFLTDHDWPKVACVQIKDVVETSADIVLSGHEHSGFGIKKVNGKIFCNPGALARVTAGIGDVNMTVRVLLIDTEKEPICSFINLPETVALPSDEVIDREKLLLEKEHEEKIQNFFQAISATDLELLDTTDIFVAFAQFADDEQVDDDVRSEIFKRLSAASERIKREDDSPDDDE